MSSRPTVTPSSAAPSAAPAQPSVPPVAGGCVPSTAAGQAAGGTPSTWPVPAPVGAYGVWPADAHGATVGYSAGASPNPSDPQAVEIYFGVLQGRTPPKEQSDLQAAIAQVLSTVKTLYVPGDGSPKPQFRLYYTRLFRIAQLGLEGNAMPDIAKGALARVADDLIDAEGARVKNAHLTRLGKKAAALAAAFLGVYLALCAMDGSALLPAVGVEPSTARAFMLLWVGCFAGVWLSYAIRTTTFTLRDLVVADADRLLPLTRLVFAGALTMILGLLLALGFVDARIGGRSLAAFVDHPTLALLLGLFCGVSELLLPGMVGKRATDLLTKIQ